MNYQTHNNGNKWTFVQFVGVNASEMFRIKELVTRKSPKKKMFICNLFRNDAICISKGTTVRQKYFGTFDFPSSTRFLRTKQHGNCGGSCMCF